MGNHKLDYTSRKISEAFAKVKERRAKQLVEQPEVQTVKEKLQQQLQAIADLKAQIAVFQNADNASTKTTSVTTNNTSKISDEEYQATIIQKMVTLIKQRKIK